MASGATGMKSMKLQTKIFAIKANIEDAEVFNGRIYIVLGL